MLGNEEYVLGLCVSVYVAQVKEHHRVKLPSFCAVSKNE